MAEPPPFSEPDDDAFQDAIDRGATDEVLRLGDALLQAGDYRRGRHWLEQAVGRLPPDGRLLTRLLEIHHRYRNWPRFDEVAEAARALDEQTAELHHTIGCGYEARGEWERACDALGRAVALDPEDVDSVIRLARCRRASGHPERAVTVLRAALKRHDEAAPLHAALGYAWIQAEATEKAVTCFQCAVDRAPDWHPYLNDLAGALMLCERYDEAARTAAWSLKLHKKNERGWTVYAISHARLGDPKRAEQGYRNAIRAARDPSRAKGNFGLYLASRPERMLDAVRFLREANEAHPDWTEVGRRLRDLVEPGA